MENWWMTIISTQTCHIKAVVKGKVGLPYRGGKHPVTFLCPSDGGQYQASLSDSERERIDSLTQMRGYNTLFFQDVEEAIKVYLGYTAILQRQKEERDKAYKEFIGRD
jgi:hypothetical protein